jgi:hypothetical protein
VRRRLPLPRNPTTVRMVKSGDAFITLITNKNPNGEIRGQIETR